MIRCEAFEKRNRLSVKTLDQQFRKEIEQGLNCSPIESEAIVNIVKEVYFPYLTGEESLRPGQLVVMAVDAGEPPGKALKDCKFKRVVLTLFDSGDFEYRRQHNSAALRRRQIKRMAEEAERQGALLSVEDLAYKILNVSKSTVCRDLKQLLKEQQTVPLRGQQKDIGRGITHRLQIVRDFMDRYSFVQIQRRHHHSLNTIKNYLSTFLRVGYLTQQGYSVAEIAFTLKISQYLASEYQKLYQSYRQGEYRERLEQLVASLAGRGKKQRRQSPW